MTRLSFVMMGFMSGMLVTFLMAEVIFIIPTMEACK